MALQITIPERNYGECENAYIIADLTLDNKTKKGRLELACWRNKDYRDNNAPKINNIPIVIGGEENVLEENGCIETLSWNDFAWKTGAEVYTKIKSLKVLVEDKIIDFSNAIDV